MTRQRTLIIPGSAIVACAVFAAPAAAAAPAGGCNKGYPQLRTVESLEAEATEAPPGFFAGLDVNGDGYLCNKYLPEPASHTGSVKDNDKKLK